MDPETVSRNKCAACFRQYNKMEHLVEHYRVSFHSVHEPKCGICQKHCRFFESLREHLIGPLPKVECARIFISRGCNLCLNILDSPNALRIHRAACQLSRINSSALISRTSRLSLQGSSSDSGTGAQAVALACKMVGGGTDGSLDLCARVCLIGEDENIIFQAYVKPQIPVTSYRYETTGIRAEQLRDAMPLKQAQRRIQDLLTNGEPIWKIRSRGGKARVLVGHGLDHDLDCLGVDQYPAFLIRDTATYPPLMKTSKLSNSLKYLTQAHLGYDIQTGLQDPYEDCVAAMRLYLRMRSLNHPRDYSSGSGDQNCSNYPAWRQRELEKMTPDALLRLSASDYYCWCLDS